MATVHLKTTGNNRLAPTSEDDHLRMCDSARHDRYGRHKLIENPEDADIILFVGSQHSDFWDVRNDPLVQRFRDKCFLYHSEDLILPFLPGIYPSLRSRDNFFGRAAPGGYTSVLHIDIPHLPFNPQARYLFSFRGSFATHPASRNRLATLAEHPRGFVQDLSLTMQGDSAHAPGDHRRQFLELLQNSKFSLCPRGRSPSSWRLFETLRAGRVPVIIGDEWMEPMISTEWKTFSIRVRERDVAHIPAILQEREGEAETMSRLARQIWDEWFSMEAFFHRTVDECLTLQKQRTWSERYARHVIWLALCRPQNFRTFLVSRLRKSVRALQTT
jgi:hypothetical protein